MTDLVLIHGGAHGAWCWDKLVPYLENSPTVRNIVAVDLIADAQAVANKPLEQIKIEDYSDGILNRIRREELRDIVVVGHSMAGVSIPAVVHHIPDRIRRVVYLATSNPPVGQSIEDLMQDPLSPISRGLDFESMFCNDLDEVDAKWLLGNLREDPPLPFHEKVSVCSLPPGIPSTYIICERDQALPVEFQMRQAENAQVDEVLKLDAGHSAFISRPGELAGIILQYAGG